MELYLHVPFCVKKCGYCDFLSFAASEEVRQQFVDQLTAELRACSMRPETKGREVVSVFIGGGTPSILLPEQIGQLMETIRSVFHLQPEAEITLEVNPGTLDPEKAATWKTAGINRLSLGLQSASNRELTLLGRIHTFEAFLESFRLARMAGFDNINVDLMSALPGQSEESWQETLEKIVALEPEHISAYSLIIEEGTPFYEQYGAMGADLERYGEFSEIPESRRSRYGDQDLLPGEEAERSMYHFTKEFLAANGYRRYEISNYAKEGRECRHNIGYWTGTEYLGLGLGAASLINGRRFHVIRSLEKYLAMSEEELEQGRQYEDSEIQSEQEQMEEFMFLGLRLTCGVRAADFEARFGRSLESVYGEVCSKLQEDTLLEMYGVGAERAYRLTAYGLDVSNRVLAEFLL